MFGAASLSGALAGSSGWLIAMRALQGLGAATLAPAALALLTQQFEEGPARSRALAIWGAAAAAGAPAGAMLGGLLTGTLGWGSVLLVNVPLCLALAIGALRVPAAPQPPRRAAEPDVAGAVTVTAGSAALLSGLIGAGQGQLAGAADASPCWAGQRRCCRSSSRSSTAPRVHSCRLPSSAPVRSGAPTALRSAVRCLGSEWPSC